MRSGRLFPSSIFLIIIVVSLTLVCAGCKGGFKEKETKSPKEPAAEVKQSIPEPQLGPPPPSTPKTLAPAVTETTEYKGPITLPPGDTGPPEAKPAAPAPPPVSPEDQQINEPPAPLATLPESEVRQPLAPGAAGIQAIGAPEIKPAEVKGVSPPPDEVPYEPKLVQAKTDVEIILDASGSQAAPFGAQTTTKLDMIRASLYDVISDLSAAGPDGGVNIAIRVFGAKSPLAAFDTQDTELIVPMGAPDLTNVRAILGKVTARGLSPVALALAEGIKDFPAESLADRVIVLIADGGDNTGADPCDVVAQIESGQKKTTVNVVAFDLSPADEPVLGCIAEKGSGKLFLARNEDELRASLDEAVASLAPYNFKLTAQAGTMPVPFNITVLKPGTETAIQRSKGFGVKLMRISPGSYDIRVECGDTAKVLKGAQVLAQTKVEQTISFDLGELSLGGIGNDGNPSAAKFIISAAGQTELKAELETGAAPDSIFLPPGAYDIQASLLEGQLEGFSLAEKGVEIKVGETAEKIFRFQKGSLSLKGVSSQKEAMPFVFEVFKAGRPEILVASGAFLSDGGKIELAPGNYDLMVTGTDPKLLANPRTKVSDVEIKAAEENKIEVQFEMGVIKLAAVDGQGGKLPAQFVVHDHETKGEMAIVNSPQGEAVSLPIPPGTYDITAFSLKSPLEPKPSVQLASVQVTTEKPVEHTIKFVLGTLRLRGRNTREKPLPTQFSTYKSGTDEKTGEAPVSTDWMVFDLAPAVYDVRAVNTSSEEEPQPEIWLRNVKIEDGKTVSHEAIFTAGKLKVIGRGPNNRLIKCNFKVFQYGADRELINGVTSDDWENFEIQPGKYYLEASYHDDDKSVMFKKWINIAIAENEIVEVVLRF